MLGYRSLIAPDIGFTVVYGSSATRRGWWDPAQSSGSATGRSMTRRVGLGGEQRRRGTDRVR